MDHSPARLREAAYRQYISRSTDIWAVAIGEPYLLHVQRYVLEDTTLPPDGGYLGFRECSSPFALSIQFSMKLEIGFGKVLSLPHNASHCEGNGSVPLQAACAWQCTHHMQKYKWVTRLKNNRIMVHRKRMVFMLQTKASCRQDICMAAQSESSYECGEERDTSCTVSGGERTGQIVSSYRNKAAEVIFGHCYCMQQQHFSTAVWMQDLLMLADRLAEDIHYLEMYEASCRDSGSPVPAVVTAKIDSDRCCTVPMLE